MATITLSPDRKTALLHYRDAEVLWDIGEERQINVWADFLRRWWYSETGLSPDGKTFAFVSSHFIIVKPVIICTYGRERRGWVTQPLQRCYVRSHRGV